MTEQNPIRKYAEVKKYNKDKSKWIFAGLKLAEFFAAFLFTFGIYGLGIFANTLIGTKLGIFYGITYLREGIIDIWSLGLGFLFMSIISIIIICIVIWIIYETIKAFLVVNWKWAQRLTETPEGKKERKKENERLKKQYYDERRALKGFLKGDMVRVKKNLKLNKVYGTCRFVDGMKKYQGKTYKVNFRSYEYVDKEKTYYYGMSGNNYYFDKEMLELKNPRDMKTLK